MERESRKLKRILNINNLSEDHKISHKIPIRKIENVIQKKINPDLKVNKFLGNGYYGPLYLLENNTIEKNDRNVINDHANNNNWMSNFNWTWNNTFGDDQNNHHSNIPDNHNQNNTREMICKVINMKKGKKDKMFSALLEMGMLSVLSKDIDASSYINNCLAHKVINNNLFTFFPAFTGYKLKNVIPYLKNLPQKDFEDLTGYLMRNILFGLQAIHQQKIAHQNINDCSIVVSMQNDKIMSIKFMDFGASCGVYKMPDSNNLNVEKCLNDLSYFQSMEGNNNNNLDTLKGKSTSLKKVYQYIVDGLKNLQDVEVAQSYDVWCCGLLFYDLLHTRSLSEGESASHLDGLDNPSLAWSTADFKNFRKPYRNQEGYASIIQSHMLSPIKKRMSAKDVLEELMVHDKFGGK